MRAAYGTRGALLNSGNLASSISSTVRSELRDNREQLKVARLLDFCPQIETSTVETRGLSPAFSRLSSDRVPTQEQRIRIGHAIPRFSLIRWSFVRRAIHHL